MNKTFLIGRLTKDPELRYTESNKAIANFTIAIDRTYIKEDGTKETDFINVIAFQKQAENIKKYIGKGSMVAIDGRIQVRNYDNKEGKRVYVTEIVADRVMFLDSKSNTQKEEKDSSNVVENKSSGLSDDVFSDFGSSIEITDEDISF